MMVEMVDQHKAGMAQKTISSRLGDGRVGFWGPVDEDNSHKKKGAPI